VTPSSLFGGFLRTGQIYETAQCHFPEGCNPNFAEVYFFRSVISPNIMIQLINISAISTSEVCMSGMFVLSMASNLRMHNSVVSSTRASQKRVRMNLLLGKYVRQSPT
jgi:hypothetical protein